MKTTELPTMPDPEIISPDGGDGSGGTTGGGGGSPEGGGKTRPMF